MTSIVLKIFAVLGMVLGQPLQRSSHHSAESENHMSTKHEQALHHLRAVLGSCEGTLKLRYDANVCASALIPLVLH